MTKSPDHAADAALGFIETDLRGVPAAFRPAFAAAERRLNAIIKTPRRRVPLEEGFIDIGLRIFAAVRPLDGEGRVLGRAGPTTRLVSDGLPIEGVMEFDVSDVADLAAQKRLDDVILHEMAHVLGAGTLWSDLGLLSGAGGPAPLFTGANAIAEYAQLLGRSVDAIPVEADGGPGTRDGHWDEAVFGDELLTGFISGRVRPLSRMSIASFIDLGYEADLSQADPYDPPTALSSLSDAGGGVRLVVQRPDCEEIGDAE